MKMRTSSTQAEGAEREFPVRPRNSPARTARGRAAVREVDEKCKPIAGQRIRSDAELVLLAMGFGHRCTWAWSKTLGVDLDKRGNVRADIDDYHTSGQGIRRRRHAPRPVAGGWAIREGRQCAQSIDKFLMGTTNLPR